MKYDVLIVGGGPAGMTAGLYCVRAGLKTAIISRDIGGTANSILKLENWPGYSGGGGKLMKRFYDQLKKYDIDFIMKDAKNIKKNKEGFVVSAGTKNSDKEDEELDSKSIIIATGTKRNKLGVPGEDDLKGKGVSYCITCDAFFYKDKKVAVVGGSDCAVSSALSLSDVAEKVYIFYKGENLDCDDEKHKKLEKRKNVKIFYNSLPTKIRGKKKVEGINVQVPSEKGKDKDKIKKKEKEFDVEGIFIEVGSEPITEFIGDLGLKLDKNKRIKVDKDMSTSVRGVYAAGDVTNQDLNQVVVASGEGAIAGKNAGNYIKEKQ